MPVALREASGLVLITNGGIADGPQAEMALTSGAADIVAVGGTFTDIVLEQTTVGASQTIFVHKVSSTPVDQSRC
jgi:hypothetical protein